VSSRPEQDFMVKIPKTLKRCFKTPKSEIVIKFVALNLDCALNLYGFHDVLLTVFWVVFVDGEFETRIERQQQREQNALDAQNDFEVKIFQMINNFFVICIFSLYKTYKTIFFWYIIEVVDFVFLCVGMF